jgi:hypothetical protein
MREAGVKSSVTVKKNARSWVVARSTAQELALADGFLTPSQQQQFQAHEDSGCGRPAILGLCGDIGD